MGVAQREESCSMRPDEREPELGRIQTDLTTVDAGAAEASLDLLAD